MLAKIKRIQKVIGVTPDGIWGPKSQAALELVIRPPAPQGRIKTSVKGWDFIKARVEGEDIVIDDAAVTAFGGSEDQMDSGETASGLSTRDNPNFKGCALPMNRKGSVQLRGSPIPKLPWRTPVFFTDPATGRKVGTQLIDEGPAKWTKNSGDLTVAAAREFDTRATANAADIPRLTIRIPGAAKYAV